MEKKSSETKVTHLSEYRVVAEERRRRKAERVYLAREVAAYMILPNGDQRFLSLIEVGPGGFSFQVPMARPIWTEGETPSAFHVRIFMTPKTYIELPATQLNETVDGTSLRFGCQVDQTVAAYEAYKAWVSFLGIYVKHGKTLADGGNDAA